MKRLPLFLPLLLAVSASATDAKFFRALNAVEASGRDGAIVGDGGRALGPYQIHRAYWLDSRVPGSYQDVTNRAYAERVVSAYLRRYAPSAVVAGDYQTMARIHNGGPAGASKAATLPYWRKVQSHIGQ
jgi:hypothetical protein